MTEFSEQQIIACSSGYGNQGCNGGWYQYAWNYYAGGGTPNFAITADQYLYMGAVYSCKYDNLKKTNIYASGYTTITSGDTAAMQSAIYS